LLTFSKRGGRKQPQSAEFVATTDEEDDEEGEANKRAKLNEPSLKSLTRKGVNRKDIQSKENYEPQKTPLIQEPPELTSSKDRRKNKPLSSTTSGGGAKVIAKEDGDDEVATEELPAPDLVTVNMDDLTDMLYTSKSSSKSRNTQRQDRQQIFFARKSEPNKGGARIAQSMRHKSLSLQQQKGGKNGRNTSVKRLNNYNNEDVSSTDENDENAEFIISFVSGKPHLFHESWEFNILYQVP
jgi:hypothetical protein